ncbi:hypothetical protein C8R45DRAFT_930560 [Mycena sanguinolenta]|nr:hypothetical protein C8R45DRAFT_930560 [Mycena sanguinolenta]
MWNICHMESPGGTSQVGIREYSTHRDLECGIALWVHYSTARVPKTNHLFTHHGEISIDKLLDPQIEREDLDSELLQFVNGDEGTQEIMECLKKQNEEEDDKEEPQQPEFTFSTKDTLIFIRKRSLGRSCIIRQVLGYRLRLSWSRPPNDDGSIRGNEELDN